MREFNTTGPCDPTLHYMVIREALLDVGQTMVSKGRFFTLFAPRQTGKTTYFQLLLTKLATAGYTPIWVSFESLKTVSKEQFYHALSRWLSREWVTAGLKPTGTITDPVSLIDFFEQLPIATQIVLVIDEFEGIPETVLSEVMHAFRHIYHQKKNYALHALILVGVSTMADLILTSASPFNVADELQLPYFSLQEVQQLIKQYVAETGQPFEPDVIQAIYDNTAGQPGLVSALCQYLVTKAAPDITQPVTMNHFYPTLQAFLTTRADKNIVNIIQKARQKSAFMLKLLFNPQPLPFSLHEPNIGWLYANGVVDNVAGVADVTVPLYKKALITTFRPIINGEAEHYLTSAKDTLSKYHQPDGRLNVNALIEAYNAYVKRRGFRAFDVENLHEAACHYSLDGFLYFFMQQFGGETYIEVPSGRGRVDILLRYHDKSYIIETKIFSSNFQFEQGKAQLAQYLQTERLREGYYVVFSNLHTKDDTLYTVEAIEGCQIHTHIILTTFKQASRSAVPKERRKRQSH